MQNPKKYRFVDGLKFTCLASSGSNSQWVLFLFLVDGWITVEPDEMEEAGDAGRTVNDAAGGGGYQGEAQDWCLFVDLNKKLHLPLEGLLRPDLVLWSSFFHRFYIIELTVP